MASNLWRATVAAPVPVESSASARSSTCCATLSHHPQPGAAQRRRSVLSPSLRAVANTSKNSAPAAVAACTSGSSLTATDVGVAAGLDGVVVADVVVAVTGAAEGAAPAGDGDGPVHASIVAVSAVTRAAAVAVRRARWGGIGMVPSLAVPGCAVGGVRRICERRWCASKVWTARCP
ncbi:hypothetical protein [Cellulomonas iranensis]|uniref:hypothetical protein n=1 Tax=Cellulomonas iranensis TaxID=76862 RepID=UPI0011789B94|nr:hypothetical protein [Cellulomonas iranensis]